MIRWFFELPFALQLGLIYGIAINLVAFFYFGVDKMRSQLTGRRRVSEQTLWFLSAIGGSIGALLGMHYFRHKTQKVSFQAGIAIILAVQVVLIFLFST